uniref:Peptidase A1 domain-containing protein n=1 Tax=Steinernema glaseri TaxID=37863 RepID=A0A1I7ZES5_9BILA
MRNTIDAVLALVLIFVASAHSLTKVPYLVHPSITLDSNQKNALLNAILDLNMRTCLKFVPRKRQRDYILFTDLGSSTICWNIFQPLDGQRAVNGGEYCVRPMQPPYQPREVFSVCDIQYINEVHNCPQASLELDKRCPASGSSMTTSELTPLYRAYNEKLGVTDHFYTTDRMELETMVVEGYFIQRQMGYIAKDEADRKCPCLTPLFRLFNSVFKDHMYTTNMEERNLAEQALGYTFEGIEGYCTKSPGCGADQPLYRHYNPIAKDHMYTVDKMEKIYYDKNGHHGYHFERIECYVWPHPETDRSCDNAVDSP